MPANDDVRSEYFYWMIEKVVPNSSVRDRYLVLFSKLFETNFYFTIPMDKNRYIDGINLRHRFAYERGYDDESLNMALSLNECSMLEMISALALRCEESIMFDPDIGNRIDAWFFEMIKSLRLDVMTNENFDDGYFNFCIDRFLKHEYCYDGTGGLFTVKKPDVDMRKIEIWYQMHRYLNELLRDK